MGLTIRALNKFALSKLGTKLYKWGATDAGNKFLTTKMPGFETIVATSFYIASTELQYHKGNLDSRRRSLLQSQNVASGIFGYTVGSWASKKVSNYINNTVIPNLKPKLVPDVHKVKLGLQVALPLLMTAIAVRGIGPAIIAWGSGLWEQHKAEKRAKQEKLNKLA